MPHLHRFYHPIAPPLEGEVALSREEAHHAMRVLRVRTGDAVGLFNGEGYAWTGAITALTRNEVLVSIQETQYTPRPEPTLTLVQAWLHREKLLDDLIRHATVLGVDRILFFRADHSEKKPHIAEKWERLAVEACKQCGRLWLPRTEVAASLAEALDRVGGDQIVLASMEGPHQALKALKTDRPTTFVVGPEGDFSDAESNHARSVGAVPISLGPYTLRSEMAASTGITLIQHHLGHLG